MTVQPETSIMAAEAREAPAAVAGQRSMQSRLDALGSVLRERGPRLVATCARGSSDHAATYAKYLIESRIGLPVVSAAPSLASIYSAPVSASDSLLIAISQSGRSPDLLASVAAWKAGGSFVVALVNADGSPLADAADVVLPLGAGDEAGIAATKSYIASLTMLVRLVAAWAGLDRTREQLDALPALLSQSLDQDWSPLVEGLANRASMYVLGRGLGFGIAQEAALKLKETSQIHAEAFSSAELMHGPMALVCEGFPILLFRQSDEAGDSTAGIAKRLVERGARLFLAGGEADGATSLPTIGADPLIEPILQIQSFYLAASALARRRGLDPDRPPHLSKVTHTL